MSAADDVDGLVGRAARPGHARTPTARQEFLDLLETLGPDDPRTVRLPQGAGRPPVLTPGPAAPTAGTGMPALGRG